MARQPKIWGHIECVPAGMGSSHHNQARVIVKAATVKRARELLGQSRACGGGRIPSAGYFRTYWSETGNDVEHAVAANDAEGVWYTPDGSGHRAVDDCKRDPGAAKGKGH